MLSSAIKTQPLTPPTLACKVKPQPSEMMPDRPNCPRCDSSNTKFCYYNNYNFSQPRYFCKSCRRYWTLGGSLRNIPAGGTPRKNAPPPPSSSKRRRGPVPVASAASSSPPPSSGTEPTSDSISGTFAKLLSEPLPSGFLTLGDAGLDDLDAFFDPEKTTTSTWPFLPADDGVVFDVGDGWDFTGIGGGQGGEDLSVVGGGEDGNCFGWADLAAIPTPGKNF